MNAITLNSNLTLRGDRSLTLSGTITGQGAAANRQITASMESSATTTLNLSGPSTSTTTRTARDLVFANSTLNSPLLVTGILANGGGAATDRLHVASGLGYVVVSGNNTYTGGTFVADGGRLRITHSNALGLGVANTVVEVTRGGALELDGRAHPERRSRP